MSVKCMLPKFLRNESQVDFAKRIGISRQTINKLYSGKISGIDFDTLNRICRGLGISIGDLLVLEQARFEQMLVDAPEVNIILGARFVEIPDEFGRTTYGVGPDDVYALSYITERMTRLSSSPREIKIDCFPPRHRWQEIRHKDCEKRAEQLLKSSRGIIFALCSDRSNGFTEYILNSILDIGYDSTENKSSQYMKLPYKMAWGYQGEKPPIMSLDQKIHDPQGIWDAKNNALLIEIPNDRQIAQFKENESINDGAIVYIDLPNSHHPGSIIVGIAGFGGKGTYLTSKYLFKEESLKDIDRKVEDAEKINQPIFFAVKVKYTKGGSRESAEFIDASMPLS